MPLRLQTEASLAPLGFNFSHSVYCIIAYAVSVLYFTFSRLENPLYFSEVVCSCNGGMFHLTVNPEAKRAKHVLLGNLEYSRPNLDEP